MGAPKLKSKVGNTSSSSQEIKPVVYDANPFWQSTLFSDVYLRNDVPHKYRDIWEQDSTGSFYEFCERFRDLCDELQGESFENWSERTTINRFIKPVLKLLGWSTSQQDPWIEDESFSVKEQGDTKTYKPDFVIVHDVKQLKYIEKKSGDAKLEEARTSSIISIEAKYWGRIDESKYSHREDKDRADKKSQADATRSLDFDEQCLKYVEILHHDYGILTDGRTWRLFHKDLSAGSFKRCYQFNLGNLIKHVQAGLDKQGSDYLTFVDNAKYFYHLFSKSALYNADGGRRFVDDLIADSRKYSNQIEDDLKLRFVSAMAIACNGFRTSLGKSYTSNKLDLIRSAAESHIFTILFIRYCESRNILPIRQNPEYRMMSLSNVIDKLDLFDPEKEADDLNTPILKRRFKDQFQYTASGTELHDSLLKIVEILHNGFQHPAAKFCIAGFRETVFSNEELVFTKKNKISNREFVRLLFELTYIEDESSSKLQQIAYSFFAPRQLGSIYESFLDFRLEEADEDLAFVKKAWVAADISSDKIKKLKVPTVKKGQLFFSPDSEDRKTTGSYYTPDYIVQFILKEALNEALIGKSAKQLLDVKVCDPSMGSGHFLAGALDYLARVYVQKLDDEAVGDLNLTLTDAKQKILRHCIYGVDINPRAVKLAKMSLWLESAHSGKALEPLANQLIVGDSLLDPLPFSAKMDAIFGNPPWVTMKGKQKTLKSDTYLEGLKAKYEDIYEYKGNLYNLFLSATGKWLKENGTMSFILPATLLINKYLEKTRTSLAESYSVESLCKLKFEVFDDVTTGDTLIASFRNRPQSKSITISECHDRTQIGTYSRVPSADVIRSNGSWYVLPTAGYSLLTKMETLGKVGDIFEIRNGINTGNVAKFLMKERKSSPLDKKFLEGKNIKQFKITWTGLFVYYNKNLGDEVSLSQLETRQKKLDFALRSPDLFERPKVVIRQTGDRPIAAFDSERFYTRHSTHLILHPDDDIKMLKAVCAILNSDIYAQIYETMVGEQGKTFAEVKATHIENLPLPLLVQSQIEQLARIHDTLVEDADDKQARKKLEKLIANIMELDFLGGHAAA